MQPLGNLRKGRRGGVGGFPREQAQATASELSRSAACWPQRTHVHRPPGLGISPGPSSSPHLRGGTPVFPSTPSLPLQRSRKGWHLLTAFRLHQVQTVGQGTRLQRPGMWPLFCREKEGQRQRFGPRDWAPFPESLLELVSRGLDTALHDQHCPPP